LKNKVTLLLAAIVLFMLGIGCGAGSLLMLALSGDVAIDSVAVISTIRPTAEPILVSTLMPAPEPTLVPTLVPTDIPTLVPSTYGIDMLETMAVWMAGFEKLSGLFGLVSDDPSIVNDSTWQATVFSTMDTMQKATADLRALTPPEELWPAHEAVLNAADHLDACFVLLRSGILNMNPTTLLEGLAELELFTEDMDRASILLDTAVPTY